MAQFKRDKLSSVVPLGRIWQRRASIKTKISLKDLFDGIKKGKWKKQVLKARELYKPNKADQGPYSAYKEKNLQAAWLHHLPLLTVDWETASVPENLKPFTFALFESVSGKGYALVLRIPDGLNEKQLENFRAAVLEELKMPSSKGQYSVDRCRLVSFDPNIYVNLEAKIYTLQNTEIDLDVPRVSLAPEYLRLAEAKEVGLDNDTACSVYIWLRHNGHSAEQAFTRLSTKCFFASTSLRSTKHLKDFCEKQEAQYQHQLPDEFVELPAALKETKAITIPWRKTINDNTVNIGNSFLQHFSVMNFNSQFYMYVDNVWRVTDPLIVWKIFTDNFLPQTNLNSKTTILSPNYRKSILSYLEGATVVDSEVIKIINGDHIRFNTMSGVVHVDKAGKITFEKHPTDHSVKSPIEKYYLMSKLPYAYDPKADCPQFKQWLESILPDEDIRNDFLMFAGSVFTRTKLDKICMAYGPASTGKSSLVNALSALLGDAHVSISADMLFTNGSPSHTQAAFMEGKLLCTDTEIKRISDTSTFKKVASQEPLIGWIMNKSRFPVINYGRVMVCSNDFRLHDTSGPIKKRLLLLPLLQVIPNSVRDPKFVEKMVAKEAAGILNFIIQEGLMLLIKNKFWITGKSSSDYTDFVLNEDSIAHDWFHTNFALPDIGDRMGAKEEYFTALKRIHGDKAAEFTHPRELFLLFTDWVLSKYGESEGKALRFHHFKKDLKSLCVEHKNYKIGGKQVRKIYLVKA